MNPALILSVLLAGASARNSDLVDTAAKAGGFQTLLAAAEQAGLADALRSSPALTVLAPTDEAFGKLPEAVLAGLLLPENRDALSTLLRHHVIAGRRTVSELLEGGTAETLAGTTLSFRIENGSLRVENAQIVDHDIDSTNGVIQVLDQVLVPKGLELPGVAESPTALIELAIRRGVPLFNRGEAEACAAIYEVTAQSLLLLPSGSLTDATIAGLRRALDRAAEQSDPVRQAWTLRAVLDQSWRDLKASAPSGLIVATGTELLSLFEFERSESEVVGPWFSVNDNVMGGISRGGFEQTSETTGAFRGALSLENNGGFSTIRSTARDLGLAGSEGLVLRVRGDGRSYAVGAMLSDGRSSVRTWRKNFSTQPGVWQEIRIPFADLELSVMGQRFPGNPLDPAEIRSLTFSISDKNESPFSLEIDWIRAYRSGERSDGA